MSTNTQHQDTTAQQPGSDTEAVAPGDEGLLRPWEARVHRRTDDLAEPC